MVDFKKRINVAIIGVGNCASALVQGVAVKKAGHRSLDGVIYENIGGYLPQDVNFVAAFDVDERKVGKKLKEAIFSLPNCCWKIIKDGEFEESEKNAIDDCDVFMGPILDGVSKHMTECDEKFGFKPSLQSTPLNSDEIVKLLKAHEVDVIVNYLPVGSQIATEFWANICLEAEIAFCNCIPVFIASNKEWEQKFIDKNLPLIGDDMRSQFGASVLSQMFQELAFDRGHKVHAHIQQNFGGNTDFLNMKNQDRLESKKISKENVIKSQNELRGVETKESFLFAGPSDYIQYYGDNKVAHFRLEMSGFGGAPVILDAKLSVQDSPNSAGVVIDAIRFLRVAREMGIRGSLRGASAFTQKTPPEQLQFADAKKECDALAARLYTEKTRIQM
jgi:myo-inositol-1-phosphate synthase